MNKEIWTVVSSSNSKETSEIKLILEMNNVHYNEIRVYNPSQRDELTVALNLAEGDLKTLPVLLHIVNNTATKIGGLSESNKYFNGKDKLLNESIISDFIEVIEIPRDSLNILEG